MMGCFACTQSSKQIQVNLFQIGALKSLSGSSVFQKSLGLLVLCAFSLSSPLFAKQSNVPFSSISSDNTKQLCLTFILAVLLPFSLLFAQEADTIFLEAEADENQEINLYWDEHFQATAGFAITQDYVNPENRRSYASQKLGWQDDFDWIRFHVEVELFFREYHYLLELKPIERTLRIADDKPLHEMLGYWARSIGETFDTNSADPILSASNEDITLSDICRIDDVARIVDEE